MDEGVLGFFATLGFDRRPVPSSNAAKFGAHVARSPLPESLPFSLRQPKWATAAGMGVVEIRRLKQLEEENAKLKRLVADLSLDKTMLQDVLRKKF